MQRIFKSIKSSTFSIMIVRLIMVLLLFSLSRVVFYSFNTDFFGSISRINWRSILLGGFRFDVVSVLYLNILYILLQIIPGKFKYNFFSMPYPIYFLYLPIVWAFWLTVLTPFIFNLI